mmetsp:Transcript_35420/g.81702  ORF Transcript_35420/g.81702 Transcript_35420/m.81702 type:complete len:250 (+) Transcript_35420:229-978(+)
MAVDRIDDLRPVEVAGNRLARIRSSKELLGHIHLLTDSERLFTLLRAGFLFSSSVLNDGAPPIANGFRLLLLVGLLRIYPRQLREERIGPCNVPQHAPRSVHIHVPLAHHPGTVRHRDEKHRVVQLLSPLLLWDKLELAQKRPRLDDAFIPLVLTVSVHLGKGLGSLDPGPHNWVAVFLDLLRLVLYLVRLSICRQYLLLWVDVCPFVLRRGRLLCCRGVGDRIRTWSRPTAARFRHSARPAAHGNNLR